MLHKATETLDNLTNTVLCGQCPTQREIEAFKRQTIRCKEHFQSAQSSSEIEIAVAEKLFACMARSLPAVALYLSQLDEETPTLAEKTQALLKTWERRKD